MSANGPLEVGHRVRRLRGRPSPGTVVRVIRPEPHQVVEVAWHQLAHPFDRIVMPASQLKRLPEQQLSPRMNARHFNVGDRVERLGIRRNLPRGTVLRIIQGNPQIVEVAWDGERSSRRTPELSQALRLIPQEEDPGCRG
jgi:hypothetical protein